MATVNIYDMADTWNDGGTTFTAIKMTVTQSAAASGSLLLDLQHGASGSEASKFSVDSDGAITTGKIVTQGSKAAPVVCLSADGDATGLYGAANGALFYGGTSRGNQFAWYPDGIFTIGYNGSLRISGSEATSGGGDAILSRKTGANLQLGAADNATSIVAQTLSVQSVASGGATPNIAGEDFTIQGSAGTGLGAGGSIIFQVAPAGGSGTGQNTLVDALTIQSNRTFTSNNWEINPSGTYQAGKTGTPSSAIASTGIYLGSDSPIRWSSTGAWSGTADAYIYRDAANTLALRNGANAQTFNIYNTYTDASNYERGFMRYASNMLEIGHEAAGTGVSARAVKFLWDSGNSNLTLAANGATITHTTDNINSYYQVSGNNADALFGVGSNFAFVGSFGTDPFIIRSNNIDRLSFDTTGSVRVVTALTVATLPGTPSVGMVARVTDASAPAVGSTVSGGGAANALVWYNGSAWTVIGV